MEHNWGKTGWWWWRYNANDTNVTHTQSCHGKMKNRFFVKPSWILAFVSQPALALSNYHTMERMMPAAVISSGVK